MSSDVTNAELATAADTAVGQCLNLATDESIVIVTDDERRPIGEALYAAARDVTNDATILQYPPGEQHGGEPPVAVAEAMAATDATILQGAGSGETWTFQLRFDDHDSLSEFYRQCREQGLPVDLQSIHNPGIPAGQGLGLGITDTQREALQAALEAGYFDVPRGINLQDLATQFGISDTALSQRMRRGLHNLLSSTLSQETVGQPSERRRDS